MFIEKPPAFSNIKNRDAQGIQYLFLNWLCLECFRWNFSSFKEVVISREVYAVFSCLPYDRD
jgi:hypothetical protein